MKLIKQKNEIDCGIAVAAMLTGCTYSAASKLDGNPESETGLTVKELVSILCELNPNKTVSVHVTKLSLIDYKSDSPIAMLLYNDDMGHWIAFKNNEIFDPDLTKIVKIQDYHRKDWTIKRIVSLG